MGDIVVSEGFITGEEENRVKDDRQLVSVYVEDAVYSGGALASTFQKQCPDVYIAPYVKDLRAIAELSRLPKQLVFMNAQSGEITEAVQRRRKRDEPDFTTFRPISRDDIGRRSVVLYFEELLGVPFYFDHKLADMYSWRSTLWMFGGFHCNPLMQRDTPPSRTNFIAGCDGDDVPDIDSLRYRCPLPPWAPKP